MRMPVRPGLDRIFAALSLLLFSGLVLWYLWSAKFSYYHSPILALVYLSVLLLVLVNHGYFKDRADELGLRGDNFGESLRRFGPVTVAALLLILLLGLWKGSFALHRWSDLYLYAGWAGLQQYLLQNFLRLRAENLTRPPSGKGQSPWGSVLAALCFGCYHLPDKLFFGLTAIGALLWCLLFRREPNLVVAWLSHALCGIALILFFKQGTLDSLQVGAPGFRYEQYGTGVLVGAGYDARGRPVIVTLPGHDRDSDSLVRVFSPQGELKAEWIAFPRYGFSGQLAVGDLGFQPGDEVVVAPGPGAANPALLKIFDLSGHLLRELRLPQLQNRGYGVLPKVGCQTLWITPGPGPAAASIVLQYDTRGELLAEFPFEWAGFSNSLQVQPICSDAEAPQRLLVWGTGVPVNPARVAILELGSQVKTWLEVWPDLTYGCNLTPLRWRPGVTAVAVTPGPLQGYPPWVKIFRPGGDLVEDFVAFQDRETCGSNLAAVDINGDGLDELVMGEGIGPERPSTVRIVGSNRTLLGRWDAYPLN